MPDIEFLFFLHCYRFFFFIPSLVLSLVGFVEKYEQLCGSCQISVLLSGGGTSFFYFLRLKLFDCTIFRSLAWYQLIVNIQKIKILLVC